MKLRKFRQRLREWSIESRTQIVECESQVYRVVSTCLCRWFSLPKVLSSFTKQEQCLYDSVRLKYGNKSGSQHNAGTSKISFLALCPQVNLNITFLLKLWIVQMSKSHYLKTCVSPSWRLFLQWIKKDNILVLLIIALSNNSRRVLGTGLT